MAYARFWPSTKEMCLPSACHFFDERSDPKNPGWFLFPYGLPTSATSHWH